MSEHMLADTHPPPPGSRFDSSWGLCWSGTCTSHGLTPAYLLYAGTTFCDRCVLHQCDDSWWSRDSQWWGWSEYRLGAMPPGINKIRNILRYRPTISMITCYPMNWYETRIGVSKCTVRFSPLYTNKVQAVWWKRYVWKSLKFCKQKWLTGQY